jgi:hypothetical protein
MKFTVIAGSVAKTVGKDRENGDTGDKFNRLPQSATKRYGTSPVEKIKARLGTALCKDVPKWMISASKRYTKSKTTLMLSQQKMTAISKQFQYTLSKSAFSGRGTHKDFEPRRISGQPSVGLEAESKHKIDALRVVSEVRIGLQNHNPIQHRVEQLAEKHRTVAAVVDIKKGEPKIDPERTPLELDSLQPFEK